MLYKGTIYIIIFAVSLLFSNFTDAKEQNSKPISEFVNILFSYNYGKYENTYEGLLKYAKLKNVQAQIRLGESLENGNGVEPNLIDAYSWYSLASETGNPTAKIAKANLKKKLTSTQLEKAEKESVKLLASIPPLKHETRGPDDAPEILKFDTISGAFDGTVVDNLTFETYKANATAREMIDDILSYSLLPKRSFTVRETSQVPNAAAAILENRRFILYNPNFMRQVENASSTPWEAYSIMAHEVGHHLAGHTLTQGGSRPPTELEADYFSGGILARMGSNVNNATAAMRKIASPEGSQTHPPRDQRVKAIADGWSKAKQQMGGSDNSPPPPPDIEDRTPRTTPPPPPPIANVCVVGPGPNDFCRMMVQIPVGSSCSCYTPYGTFPGVAQ